MNEPARATPRRQRPRPVTPPAEAHSEPQESLEVEAAPMTQRTSARAGGARQAAREPSRDPIRSDGGVTVYGRDGEVLTRKRRSVGDPFHIPQESIPRGWSYQWNPYTVLEQQATDQQVMMAENGWRPVMADRHPGQFMPTGYKGAIIRGGLRLEERPMELTIEARREEYERAHAQIADRNASLRLTRDDKAKMPPGFTTQHARVPAHVTMSIDHGADIPRPHHELDDGSGGHV